MLNPKKHKKKNLNLKKQKHPKSKKTKKTLNRKKL